MARPWKVLNVAEKNDAAKELSKVMSRGRFNRVGAVLQLPGCVVYAPHLAPHAERGIFKVQ